MNKTYDPIAEYDRYEAMQEMAYQCALREDYCKMCKWYDDEYDIYYDIELGDGFGVCRMDGEVVRGNDHPIEYACESYEY